MLDAHFGDVGDIGDIGDVDLGRATARPARSSAAPRDLDPEIRPWWVTHMQPLPPADSLRLRHRALYRLPRPCPDSDAAQYIADRLTENISDPGAPSHAQSRGGARWCEPGLRDLAVVNAAVSGDRGPPNSRSLAKARPGGLAWARPWNLLVADLQDPTNDQPDKYRQRHQHHDERHPHHQDRGGPVSDVHAIDVPAAVPP